MQRNPAVDEALDNPWVRERLGLDEAPKQGIPANYIDQLPNVRDVAARGVEWLVDGLIPEGQLALLTGGFGAGKSMLALAMAAAISRGGPFLGRATERRNVLILDRENPASVIAERIEMFGIDEHSVKVWGGWADHEAPGVDCLVVLDWCKKHRPFVVIDTLIRFHGGEESSASDTARVMGKFRTLTSTGATLLVLHHTGKGSSSKEYRGSSDIPGAVDAAFLLERKEGTTGLDSLTLRSFKMRCAEEPAPLSLRLGESGFDVTDDPSGKRNNEAISAVIEYVSANQGHSQAKIIDSVRKGGLGRNEIDRAIKSAIRSGQIQTKTGTRGAVECFIPGWLELTL